MKSIEKYFHEIDKKVKSAYNVVAKAKKQGFDPETKISIPLARNMAERVEGLVSAAAPQIIGSGISKRIQELEKKYGTLDWRIALTIADEITEEKLCKFNSKLEAAETGIRIGFAYLTLGTVSSPLEGFVCLKIKKRKDGKDYLAISYSGPIRSAGGTAAAASVILADYIRKKLNIHPYDPTEKEIQRMITELYDYHERVTNLQYLPSKEEIYFLVKNLPVQIDGDPSERIEVSNYKDLDRIETNRVRNGPCLVIGECLAQKAPKLLVQLNKWGSDFKLDNWKFLEQFVNIQKKTKSRGSDATKEKIAPIYTYIEDLVAGRPVLAHPLRQGGFRLRYGRSRASGYSAGSIHPSTTLLLNKYLAIGTQLKVERPGKATALSCCDSIDSPIVKLNNDSVLRLETVQSAKQLAQEIKEILFLGDILFSYGDFFNRVHPLLPAGYCDEWYAQELEKATVNIFGTIDLDKLSEFVEIPKSVLEDFLKNPLQSKLSAEDSVKLSEKMNIPLQPRYTYYWKAISIENLLSLIDMSDKVKIIKENNQIQKLIFPLEEESKRTLELIGIPHAVINKEFIVIEKDDAVAFAHSLNIQEYNKQQIQKIIEENKSKNPLEIINKISRIKIRDKAGTFIGARMGRPEKAKMRKLTGSPHALFPIGEEGGKLRSFQSALEAGKITAELPIYKCAKCNKKTIFSVCETCNKKTKKQFYCNVCGLVDSEECKHGKTQTYQNQEIDINYYFKQILKKLNFTSYPDLIKGVRGTSNKDHMPEHIIKGILRAKHEVYVNKDGTTRFDMTQLTITHFKPKEINTSIEKLKSLDYEYDTQGKPLENPDQVLELKPQDVILPACDSSPEEGADNILCRISLFIDELLEKLYNIESFYNTKSKEDIIGHLVIALAPHTSAGIIGRVIGFSKTQVFFAHPMFHAATRRDCFSADTYLPLFMDGKWQIKKIGEAVDKINPSDVIDDFGTREVKIDEIGTIGHKFSSVRINNFTKHTLQPMVQIKTKLGRTLKTTQDHKHIVFQNGKERVVRARVLKLGDSLAIPYKIKIAKNDIKKFDLLSLFSDQEWVMVSGANNICKGIKKYARDYFTKKDYSNYTRRDSYPLKFIHDLRKKNIIKTNKLFLSAKRDHIKIQAGIDVSKKLLQIIGLYVAEGYSRKVTGKLYQVYIAAQDKESREFITKNMKNIFGLNPSENKTDRVTYSSRVLYHFFTSILECGSSAYEKRMPPLFFNLPNKKLGYLLSGYFEGDGSVSKSDLRITFDTVSGGLLRDLDFIFGQLGIFVKNYTYTSFPGKKLRDFYERKGKEIPKFTITKGIIQSIFVKQFSKFVGFIFSRKKSILSYILNNRKASKIKQNYNDKIMFDVIASIESLPSEISYCLNVPGNKVIANSLLSKQCDGDEASVILLMDALLNFSRQFLPNSRGTTQDTPLVLTSHLIPSEVDDMVFDMDVSWKYPLEFYEACLQYKQPWDVEIDQIGKRLNTDLQYEKMGFTHNTSNINLGVKCSAYKLLPSMEEKLKGQMDLAEKIRAVDTSDVARLVIEKHFIRDIRGNLRKFSQQTFRCVMCNEKYRRPPLIGRCIKCRGRIIFTVSEGSIIKYLEPAISLAEKYSVPSYLKQSLEITKRRVEGIFGKEKEKQAGLGKWF